MESSASWWACWPRRCVVAGIQEARRPVPGESRRIATTTRVAAGAVVLWCEGGLRSLLLYLNDNNNDRHEAAAVNAIRNLVRVISTRNDSAGDTTMKQRLVREQGCLPLLVQIMLEHESKDAREVAVETLASLTTYPPNAREMSSEDDKCVPALVHLLDPNPDNTSTNEYAIQCLLSLASTNKRCRKLMISHGVEGHLRRLSDLNVQGATELLHRLEGGRIRSLFGIRKQ
ncbi:hypothetical protein PR202_gb13404 [Eleusine coracana subsp. coracana]|uniref:Uncharacterized protein n=1 Tax=Eleusine coracana subsp. coracana TaxID=191504 RepID=A0AAV5ETN6_ELECO|nr:hypothetical protein PR202_gb13404 [Eleusine coracana subsp. coracana]